MPCADDLPGPIVAQFLMQTGVDKGFLGKIWTLCTQPSSPNMSQAEFFCALRYISLLQAGEMPLSQEKLAQFANENLPLSKFHSLSIPGKPFAVIDRVNVAL